MTFEFLSIFHDFPGTFIFLGFSMIFHDRGNPGYYSRASGTGADINTVLDRFMQRGYAIQIRQDQKGSVFGVLGPNGYSKKNHYKTSSSH